MGRGRRRTRPGAGVGQRRARRAAAAAAAATSLSSDSGSESEPGGRRLGLRIGLEPGTEPPSLRLSPSPGHGPAGPYAAGRVHCDSTVTMACPALAAGHGTQSGCYRPSHGGGGPGPSVGPPRRAAHWQAVRLALAGSGSRAGVDSESQAGPAASDDHSPAPRVLRAAIEPRRVGTVTLAVPGCQWAWAAAAAAAARGSATQ